MNKLAEVYVSRGVERPLALQVAAQLMAKDALSAHARDELGINSITTARPVQAQSQRPRFRWVPQCPY